MKLDFNKTIKEAFDFNDIEVETTEGQYSAGAIVEHNKTLDVVRLIYEVLLPGSKDIVEFKDGKYYYNRYSDSTQAKSILRQMMLNGWVWIRNKSQAFNYGRELDNIPKYYPKLKPFDYDNDLVYVSPDYGAVFVQYDGATKSYYGRRNTDEFQLLYTGEVLYTYNTPMEKSSLTLDRIKHNKSLLRFISFIYTEDNEYRENENNQRKVSRLSQNYISWSGLSEGDLNLISAIAWKGEYPIFIMPPYFQVYCSGIKSKTGYYDFYNVIYDEKRHIKYIELGPLGEQLYDAFAEGTPVSQLYKKYDSLKLQKEEKDKEAVVTENLIVKPVPAGVEDIFAKCMGIDKFKAKVKKSDKLHYNITNPCVNIVDKYGYGPVFCSLYQGTNVPELSYKLCHSMSNGMRTYVIDSREWAQIWHVEGITPTQFEESNNYNKVVHDYGSSNYLANDIISFNAMPWYAQQVFLQFPDVTMVSASPDGGVIMFITGKTVLSKAPKKIYKDPNNTKIQRKSYLENSTKTHGFITKITGVVDYTEILK